MKNWHKVALAVYATGALVTFGHSAARGNADNAADMAECRARAEVNPHTVCMPLPPAWVKGTFGSVLWPLYWSWTAFEEKENV